MRSGSSTIRRSQGEGIMVVTDLVMVIIIVMILLGIYGEVVTIAVN